MGSKLGPHFIGSPGLERWIAAGPAVYKFDPTGLGASSAVPPGPLVIGKLDQEDPALGLTDWKALMNRGMTPEAAADLRFYAQTDIYAGANRPRVNRYEANPRIDVWEDDNEVVPDNEAEAAWYAQYCIEMMRLYEGIGKRRANFSFAVGTPDVDIWKHLLSAVRHARDNGHYIALHEYMGYEPDYGVGWKQVDTNRRPTTNVWHGRSDKSYPWGWAALRYRYIWDTVLSPAGLGNVRLLITELGCDSVESVTPVGKPVGTWKEHAPHWTAEGKDAEAHYAEMLAWYDQRMMEDAYVAGGVVFTVGSVGIWRNWDIAGTKTEALLVDYISRQPNDPPPPPVVQPPAGVNLLANPSFELGWADSGDYSTTQNPTGWTVAWNIGSSFTNPHSEYPYLLGEAVHKNKAMLPEHEREVFIWGGEWCFKLFAGQRAFWARLKQTLDLPAAKYRLSTPVWVDAYHMAPGPKDYDVDANQAEIMVKCNGVVVRDWTALPSGGRRETVTEWQHPGGACELAIHLRMNWPINNNFFLDGWSLEAVPVTPPPVDPPPPPDDDEEPYKMTVVLLPPVLTEAEALTIYKQRFPNKNTIAYSWDDARALLDSPRSADTSELIAYGLYRWPDAARAEIMAYNPVVQAVPAPPPPPVTPPPVVDTRPIIDISHHQGTLNWDRFAPKVQAVIIRIGNGYTEDTQARRNCAEAIKRGVPFATYHYFQPTLDPVKQADFYGKLAREIAPGRLCCVDLEEPNGLTTATADRARAYINRLGDIIDHDPMIYTSLNYWTQLGRPAWGIEYPLWIAAWTTAARPIVPAPFGDWTLWQYAVDTINPAEWGVQSTRLDFNRFNPRWGTPVDYFDDTWYVDAPAPTAIDLLPFLQGQHRRQFDMGHDAGTQTTQVWHLGPKDWLYVKGENGEYERLGLRTWNGQEWIFRFEDTSESAERFYAHYLNEGGPIGAPWLPRYAEVGKWYETPKFVQHYLKAGCAKQNSRMVTDRLRVVSYPRTVNYASTQSLARLDEVITVEWSAGEQYDFAPGRGCVAFRDDNRTFWFIGDLQGRQDKSFKKPTCIPLGW